MKTLNEILSDLQGMGSERNIEGMKRFGIAVHKTFGVSNTTLKEYVRMNNLKRSHALALALWETEWRECRILAALVDAPQAVTPEQMDDWVRGFDSWDVCDTVCGTLLARTPFAWRKAFEWIRCEGANNEFIRRAGIVLMAWLAVHDKRAADEQFLQCFPVLERVIDDERNFIKKAVSWAARQIGKRNESLRKEAIAWAERWKTFGYSSARWVASSVLRELQSAPIIARVAQKTEKMLQKNLRKKFTKKTPQNIVPYSTDR